MAGPSLSLLVGGLGLLFAFTTAFEVIEADGRALTYQEAYAACTRRGAHPVWYRTAAELEHIRKSTRFTVTWSAMLGSAAGGNVSVLPSATHRERVVVDLDRGVAVGKRHAPVVCRLRGRRARTLSTGTPLQLDVGYPSSPPVSVGAGETVDLPIYTYTEETTAPHQVVYGRHVSHDFSVLKVGDSLSPVFERSGWYKVSNATCGVRCWRFERDTTGKEFYHMVSGDYAVSLCFEGASSEGTILGINAKDEGIWINGTELFFRTSTDMVSLGSVGECVVLSVFANRQATIAVKGKTTTRIPLQPATRIYFPGDVDDVRLRYFAAWNRGLRDEELESATTPSPTTHLQPQSPVRQMLAFSPVVLPGLDFGNSSSIDGLDATLTEGFTSCGSPRTTTIPLRHPTMLYAVRVATKSFRSPRLWVTFDSGEEEEFRVPDVTGSSCQWTTVYIGRSSYATSVRAEAVDGLAMYGAASGSVASTDRYQRGVVAYWPMSTGFSDYGQLKLHAVCSTCLSNTLDGTNLITAPPLPEPYTWWDSFTVALRIEFAVLGGTVIDNGYFSLRVDGSGMATGKVGEDVVSVGSLVPSVKYLVFLAATTEEVVLHIKPFQMAKVARTWRPYNQGKAVQMGGGVNGTLWDVVVYNKALTARQLSGDTIPLSREELWEFAHPEDPSPGERRGLNREVLTWCTQSGTDYCNAAVLAGNDVDWFENTVPTTISYAAIAIKVASGTTADVTIRHRASSAVHFFLDGVKSEGEQSPWRMPETTETMTVTPTWPKLTGEPEQVSYLSVPAGWHTLLVKHIGEYNSGLRWSVSANQDLRWTYGFTDSRPRRSKVPVQITKLPSGCQSDVIVSSGSAPDFMNTGSVEVDGAAHPRVTFTEPCRVAPIRLAVEWEGKKRTVSFKVMVKPVRLQITGPTNVTVNSEVVLRVAAVDAQGRFDSSVEVDSTVTLSASGLDWTKDISGPKEMQLKGGQGEWRGAFLTPSTGGVLYFSHSVLQPAEYLPFVFEHCAESPTCNGHGTCHPEQGCVCSGNWDPDTLCGTCLPGYFDPSCSSACPGLKTTCTICSGHGTCNDGVAGDGKCKCDDSDETGYWGGADCGNCKEAVFGARCRTACPPLSSPRDVISPPCHGHGTCSWGRTGDGTCTCDENWDFAANCKGCIATRFGPDCSQKCKGITPDGKPCSGHGECNSNGMCKCFSVFTPEDGESPCSKTCPDTRAGVCNGHGTCEAGGTCRCDNGYAMPDCRCLTGACTAEPCKDSFPWLKGPSCNLTCPGYLWDGMRGDHCSGHGECDPTTGQCRCSGGWEGSRCDECKNHGYECNRTPTCNNAVTCLGCPKCENGGKCQYVSLFKTECVCLPNHHGDKCQDTWCSGCEAGKGVCLRDRGCVCYLGFHGEDCSHECPGGANSCGDPRRCVDGRCDCSRFAEGRVLQGSQCEFVCPGGDPPCNGHGTCRDGVCTCYEDSVKGYYSGTACDLAIPCNNSTRPCIHGSCGPLGKCDCDTNYEGQFCERKQCDDRICQSLGKKKSCINSECRCPENFETTAGDCDTCKAGYYGGDCESQCCGGHGRCDKNTGQDCKCLENDNDGYWTGLGCSSCMEGYIGWGCRTRNIAITRLMAVESKESIPPNATLSLNYPPAVAVLGEYLVVGGSPMGAVNTSEESLLWEIHRVHMSMGSDAAVPFLAPDEQEADQFHAILVTGDKLPTFAFHTCSFRKLLLANRRGTFAPGEGCTRWSHWSSREYVDAVYLGSQQVYVAHASAEVRYLHDQLVEVVPPLPSVPTTIWKLGYHDGLLVVAGSTSSGWAACVYDTAIPTAPTLISPLHILSLIDAGAESRATGVVTFREGVNVVIILAIQSALTIITARFTVTPLRKVHVNQTRNMYEADGLQGVVLDMIYDSHAGHVYMCTDSGDRFTPGSVLRLSAQSLAVNGILTLFKHTRPMEVIARLALDNSHRIIWGVPRQEGAAKVIPLLAYAVEAVSPQISHSRGGTHVTVKGLGFKDLGGISCGFLGTGEMSTSGGHIVSSTEVTCQTTTASDGCLLEQVRVSLDRQHFTTNQVYLKRRPVPRLQRADPSYLQRGVNATVTVHGLGFFESDVARCAVFLGDYVDLIHRSQSSPNPLIRITESPRMVSNTHTDDWMGPYSIVCDVDAIPQTYSNSLIDVSLDGEVFSLNPLRLPVKGTVERILPNVTVITVKAGTGVALPHITAFETDDKDNKILSNTTNTYIMEAENLDISKSCDGSVREVSATNGVVTIPSGDVVICAVRSETYQLKLRGKEDRDVVGGITLEVLPGDPVRLHYFQPPSRFAPANGAWHGDDVPKLQLFDTFASPLIDLANVTAKGHMMEEVCGPLGNDTSSMCFTPHNATHMAVDATSLPLLVSEYVEKRQLGVCDSQEVECSPTIPCPEDTPVCYKLVDNATSAERTREGMLAFTALTFEVAELETVHRILFDVRHPSGAQLWNVSGAVVIPLCSQIFPTCTDCYRVLRSFICKKCPADADGPLAECNGTHVLQTLPGVWRAARDSVNFYRCSPPTVCHSAPSSTLHGDELCAHGHMGPICRECIPGYALDLGSDRCEECPPVGLKALSIIFGVLFLFAFSTYTITAVLHRDHIDFFVTFMIAVNHLQLTGVLIDLSPRHHFLYRIYSLANASNFRFDRILTFSCVLHDWNFTFLNYFALYMASPLVFLPLSLLVMLAIRFYKRFTARRFRGNLQLGARRDMKTLAPRQDSGWEGKAFREHQMASEWATLAERNYQSKDLRASKPRTLFVTAVFVVWLLYLSLVHVAGHVLNCSTVREGRYIEGEFVEENEVSFLDVDPHVRCEGSYGSYRAGGLAMMVIYGIGVPLGSAVLVKALQVIKGDLATTEYLVFFTMGVGRRSYFLQPTVMVRKGAMVAIILFVRDSLQTYLAMWLCTAAALLHFNMWPYTNKLHNILEACCLVILALQLLCIMRHRDDNNTAWLSSAVALNIAAAVFLLVALILTGLDGVRRRAAKIFCRDTAGTGTAPTDGLQAPDVADAFLEEMEPIAPPPGSVPPETLGTSLPRTERPIPPPPAKLWMQLISSASEQPRSVLVSGNVETRELELVDENGVVQTVPLDSIRDADWPEPTYIRIALDGDEEISLRTAAPAPAKLWRGWLSEVVQSTHSSSSIPEKTCFSSPALNAEQLQGMAAPVALPSHSSEARGEVSPSASTPPQLS